MLAFLIVGVPLLFSVPVMKHSPGEPPGLVLAAPHDGYDMYSGDLARRVSNKLGWGTVVADEYRDTKDKRWLDVNRPTERRWMFGKRGKEQTTDRGRRTFAEYLRRLREAAQVPSGQIPLLVEFHGHNRKVTIGTREVRVDVIECATVGFSDAELRELSERYERLARERWPVGHYIRLRFEQLHPSYVYEGKRIDFYYGASGAKRAGSLQTSVVRRALHFEMPQNARSTRTQRNHFGALMSDLLRPLSRYARSETGSGSDTPRRGAADRIDGD